MADTPKSPTPRRDIEYAAATICGHLGQFGEWIERNCGLVDAARLAAERKRADELATRLEHLEFEAGRTCINIGHDLNVALRAARRALAAYKEARKDG